MFYGGIRMKMEFGRWFWGWRVIRPPPQTTTIGGDPMVNRWMDDVYESCRLYIFWYYCDCVSLRACMQGFLKKRVLKILSFKFKLWFKVMILELVWKLGKDLWWMMMMPKGTIFIFSCVICVYAEYMYVYI